MEMSSTKETTLRESTQFLFEKIIRCRIYDTLYWKKECFALNAESVVDKGVELKYIGGQDACQRPSEFLCLAFKLLFISPEREIIQLYIDNTDFKYLTALGIFYLRIVGKPVDIYKTLEPLLLDYRKLRFLEPSGEFKIIHMDEFVYDLLKKERVCDIILPRLQSREVLEENGLLFPRESPLDDILSEEEVESEEEKI